VFVPIRTYEVSPGSRWEALAPSSYFRSALARNTKLSTLTKTGLVWRSKQRKQGREEMKH